MARRIEATPVLKGNDAKEFLRRMDAAVLTEERLEWLQSAAEESKRVERKESSK